MENFRNINRRQDKARAAAEPRDLRVIELVDRAASGNSKAFGELYSIYLDRIYRYVFYKVRNKMIAEDITEEVFVKAWRSISSCKGKGHTFLPWLYRVAHNQVIDSFRSRRKDVSLETEVLVEVRTTELRVEVSLEYQELLKYIATLPQNQGQVIILKFIEGLSNREIGEAMGKSEGAIRVLQVRALATLRRKMSEDRLNQ
ncbi:sigma-70 family RNA polymerase sigma factor [Chloroflexota bacterium]